MSESDRYQVMPDLEPEEYRALKQDIEKNGVLVPIAVDESGSIIDGYHRQRVCEELDIDAPTRVYEDLSEDEKYSMAWKLNMQRRHLEQKEKKSLIKDRLNQLIDRGIDKTDAEIAEELGCSRRWVSETRRTVVNDKLSKRGVQNGSGADLHTVTDYATNEQKEKFVKDVIVDNPDKSNRSIAKQVGVSPNTVGTHRKKLPTITRPELVNGDAQETVAKLPDESVDLIVTDPPYGIEFDGQRYQNASHDSLAGDEDTELISSIADELYRVLKPDSHLYIFCRWDVLPVVIDAYGDPFDIDTTIVWDKKEGGHGMGDLQDWAPRHELIVKCSKGRRELNGDREANVIRHQDARFTASNKSHPTQKPKGLIQKLIKKSSDEGELVLDPFGGVFTTAIAAVKTDRECVSVELDTDHYSIGRDRVDELVESERTERTIIKETEVL